LTNGWERNIDADSVCRSTTQTDWLAAHLILGKPYREAPFMLLRDEEDALVDRAGALIEGDIDAIEVPVSTHCINLDALRHYPRIDGVVSDLHLHGGISSTLKFIDTVNGIGKAFWLRSTWELGVSWAAMCQLALAVPTMQRPSQTLIDWVADDLLINSEWQIVHGVVHPVYKPGLGVELNHAALERYATGSWHN